MTKAAVGMKVQAYTGRCVGLLIESTTWQGEIVKVNAKSIRVKLNHATAKFGSKIKADYDTGATVTYRFAKVLSNGNAYYKSEGNVYGSIELK